jgi:hypothetical protein
MKEISSSCTDCIDVEAFISAQVQISWPSILGARDKLQSGHADAKREGAVPALV